MLEEKQKDQGNQVLSLLKPLIISLLSFLPTKGLYYYSIDNIYKQYNIPWRFISYYESFQVIWVPYIFIFIIIFLVLYKAILNEKAKVRKYALRVLTVFFLVVVAIFNVSSSKVATREEQRVIQIKEKAYVIQGMYEGKYIVQSIKDENGESQIDTAETVQRKKWFVDTGSYRVVDIEDIVVYNMHFDDIALLE